MKMELSWLLLLPAALSVLYGFTQYQFAAALGYTRQTAWRKWLQGTLSTAVVNIAWSVLGFPLPVFYVMVYLLRAARLLSDRKSRMKNWFLLNLSYTGTMAFHMIFIGCASLVQGTAMNELLLDGRWRAFSVSAAISTDILRDVIFLFKKQYSAVLSEEAESEEARPFMAFLWLCTGYLLADSLLCAARLEPLYPPLFLTGSSVVLIFLLVRFLWNIRAIIRNNHLKEEHELLLAKLEAKEQNAVKLKRIADRDALTGVFSRRFIMERIKALMDAGTGFSLVFLDLDGLKRINDCGGHKKGDRYLAGFAAELGGRLREGDVLARVGGDEFLLLLPDCEEKAALQRISAIRDALAEKSFENITFRFSYGVTSLLAGDRRDEEELLREADQAMYLDKESRR